jgi:hypothetical protein
MTLLRVCFAEIKFAVCASAGLSGPGCAMLLENQYRCPPVAMGVAGGMNNPGAVSVLQM